MPSPCPNPALSSPSYPPTLLASFLPSSYPPFLPFLVSSFLPFFLPLILPSFLHFFLSSFLCCILPSFVRFFLLSSHHLFLLCLNYFHFPSILYTVVISVMTFQLILAPYFMPLRHPSLQSSSHPILSSHHLISFHLLM